MSNTKRTLRLVRDNHDEVAHDDAVFAAQLADLADTAKKTSIRGDL